MATHHKYLECVTRLTELIALAKELPTTKKRDTTLKYLWTALSNLQFLADATKGA